MAPVAGWDGAPPQITSVGGRDGATPPHPGLKPGAGTAISPALGSRSSPGGASPARVGSARTPSKGRPHDKQRHTQPRAVCGASRFSSRGFTRPGGTRPTTPHHPFTRSPSSGTPPGPFRPTPSDLRTLLRQQMGHKSPKLYLGWRDSTAEAHGGMEEFGSVARFSRAGEGEPHRRGLCGRGAALPALGSRPRAVRRAPARAWPHCIGGPP